MRAFLILILFLTGCHSALIQSGASSDRVVVSQPENAMPSPPVRESPTTAFILDLGDSISSHPQVSKPKMVDIRDGKFVPDLMFIHIGDSIMWVNRDDTSHRIRGSGFNSTILDWGEHHTHVFNESGSFPYQCELHAGEAGLVNVIKDSVEFIPEDEGIVRVNVSVEGFSPDVLSIRMGSVVVWHNRHPISSVNIAGSGFDSGTLKRDAIFFHQFDKRGIFPYSSTFQRNFRGNITVY